MSAAKMFPAARAREIRLVVLDVDGVLTDGRLYYDSQGRESKAFHVRDGYGIKQLIAAGIEVAVISGRASAAAEKRLDELGIRHRIMGRDDKDRALDELAGSLGVDPKAIACVGDDLPDMAMMGRAGLAIAVADAHEEVVSRADWCTRIPGGHGAVREICDRIIAARSEPDREPA